MNGRRTTEDVSIFASKQWLDTTQRVIGLCVETAPNLLRGLS